MIHWHFKPFPASWKNEHIIAEPWSDNKNGGCQKQNAIEDSIKRPFKKKINKYDELVPQTPPLAVGVTIGEGKVFV